MDFPPTLTEAPDSEKLVFLANWFDIKEQEHKDIVDNAEVQNYLRRTAKKLNKMGTDDTDLLREVQTLNRRLYAAPDLTKKYEFIPYMSEQYQQPFWYPTLSFCTHKGNLYQLYSCIIKIIPDNETTEFDPSKVWIKVPEITQ